MNRNAFASRQLPAGSSPRDTSTLSVDQTQPAFDRDRRPHLCHPTEEELIHQALDLSFQVDLAVSHIDRQIIDHISRDRNRRLIPPTPLLSPSAQD